MRGKLDPKQTVLEAKIKLSLEIGQTLTLTLHKPLALWWGPSSSSQSRMLHALSNKTGLGFSQGWAFCRTSGFVYHVAGIWDPGAHFFHLGAETARSIPMTAFGREGGKKQNVSVAHFFPPFASSYGYESFSPLKHAVP